MKAVINRRGILRSFLVLSGAVAVPAACEAAATALERKPDDGALTTLGQRLEKLARERPTAQCLRVEARPRLDSAFPNLKSAVCSHQQNVSIAKIWDQLIDPPMIDDPKLDAEMRATSMEQRWRCIRHHYKNRGARLSFKRIEKEAERSGYAAAVDRVRTIDIEIGNLARRALEFQAATLAGVRVQALAVLAFEQIEFGTGWGHQKVPHAGVIALSNAVVALTNSEGVRT